MTRYLKTAIVSLAILLCLPLVAGSDTRVTLQWDPNDPAPAGYRLFGREAGAAYDYDTPWWEGDYSYTQCTIDQLDENTTYYFVVRAFDEADNESGDSNEVQFDSGLTSGGKGGGGGGGGCFIGTLTGNR